MTMHRGKAKTSHVLLLGVAGGTIPRWLKDDESSEQDEADAMCTSGRFSASPPPEGVMRWP